MKRAPWWRWAMRGALIYLLLICAGLSRVHAQDPDPAGYRDAIDQAVREFTLRNFEESRSLFARAHALAPSARTLRGLGMTEFELRNYPTAIRRLESALASPVRALDGALRADTESLLARANDFVARYTLDARPGVTQITADGVTLELPADKKLILQVGDHVLELRTTGYQPERVRLSVNGGEVETLNVVFTNPVITNSAKTEAKKPWRKSPWLWTAVGVVVAGAATGTALALSRGSSKEPDPYAGNTGVVLVAP